MTRSEVPGPSPTFRKRMIFSTRIARYLPQVFLLALLTIPVRGSADTLTFVADEWCPYNCAPDAKERGFLIDFLTEIFEKAGHTVQYKTMPWARAIEEAREGKYTGIVGSYRDDAPDFVFPSIAPVQSFNRFWVKKGDPWRYTGTSSLSAISLGIIRDYSYGEEADAYIASADPSKVQISSGVNALETNVKKLLAGRLGAVLEDHAVMQHYMTQHALHDKISDAGVLQSQDVFIAFSPKLLDSLKHAEILSQGLQKLDKSGKKREILARYGL
jgi:polar amino acid transport system substrate-binding protein